MSEEKGRPQRKTLTFDQNDKDENTAYIMLDNLRYYQTKFITRLVIEFMERYSIDIDDDYFIIVETCKKFIESNGGMSETEVWKEKYKQMSDYLNQMSEDIDILKGKLSEVVPEKVGKSELKPKAPQHKIPDATTASSEAPRKAAQEISVQEMTAEEDDEEESYGSMLSSFKAMADG